MQDYFDVVIIGAGPAGLAAAIYTSRRGLSTLLFEESIVGGRAAYAHSIENYPGFPDGISGNELVARFLAQAKKFGSVLKPGEAVINLNISDDVKEVMAQSGKHTSKALVVTTGLKQKKLKVLGEEKFLGRGVSYCATCDGFFFKNRKVIVLGGGNEATSDIVYLSSLTKNIRWIPNTEKITADEVYLNKLAEMGIVPEDGSKVVEVFGENRVQGIKLEKPDGSTLTYEADGLFIAIGTVPTVDILKKAGLNIDDMNYVMVNDNMETNIQGVFAAGDCTGKSHQVAVAVGQGALAGINASDYVKMKKRK